MLFRNKIKNHPVCSRQCRPIVDIHLVRLSNEKKKHKGNWLKHAEWLFGIPCIVASSLSLVHCAPSLHLRAPSLHPPVSVLGTVVCCNTWKPNDLNILI